MEETLVFANHTEGYAHMYPAAIARSAQDTLLAFVEAKTEGQSPRYILVRRSIDGGQSWGPLQVIFVSDETQSIGNVCPVVDRETGTTWLAFCGRGPDRFEDTVYITNSDDDGVSWTQRVEITADVKKPEWGYYYTGPGHGIQLQSGRLLFPCHHSSRGAPQRDFTTWMSSAGSHVFYSDDHGATWHLGGDSDRFMDECQVVERADGSLLLSMRNYLGNFELGKPLSGSQQRAFATSTNGGLTWSASALNPQVYCCACMTSIVRHSLAATGDRNRIVYAGPEGPGRTNTTIRLSYDEGESWPVARQVREGNVGGSDLVVLSDGTIGLLSSHGGSGWEQTTFARFTLDWLTDGENVS